MTKIQLNTAAADNSGNRLESGAKVSVGDGKADISADRAKTLVQRNLAAQISPAKKKPASEK